MTAVEQKSAGAWTGVDLGTRAVSYTERDAILYALAVGAEATDLDLVMEDRLRVLPTFALTLAQWAPDELGARGGIDQSTSLHGGQQLTVLAPLPPSGEVTLKARVGEVWDKGTAAVFEVVVECEYFVATWSLFAPGAGGFGGDRGPSKPTTPNDEANVTARLETAPNAAALYRLTGDRHHIHIDPAAAARIGQPRPIMHGLCTLAASTLPLAEELDVHPADLTELRGRFVASVVPGEQLAIRGRSDGSAVSYEVHGRPGCVISGARAVFAGVRTCAS